MANADKQRITTVANQYVLRLTEDEAATLLTLVVRVAGDPKDSPRKHADSIAGALRVAGVPDYWDTETFNLSLGTVYFGKGGN